MKTWVATPYAMSSKQGPPPSLWELYQNIFTCKKKQHYAFEPHYKREQQLRVQLQGGESARTEISHILISSGHKIFSRSVLSQYQDMGSLIGKGK